jgi:hypothetical protein
VYPSQSSSWTTQLEDAFVPGSQGAVGVVDKLLDLCGPALRIDWRENRVVVRQPGALDEDSVEIPLEKPAFRAILARLAAMCNERAPGSVSPYGGTGELALGDPQERFRATIVNSATDQSLELHRVGNDSTH